MLRLAKKTEDRFKPTIGIHGKLLNFAAEMEMVARATFLKHKNIHQGTWRTPDDGIGFSINLRLTNTSLINKKKNL